MADKIFEIRITYLSNFPNKVKKYIYKKLIDLPDDFDFQGFVKITYIINKEGKKAIDIVEPLDGSSIDYYNKRFKDIELPTF